MCAKLIHGISYLFDKISKLITTKWILNRLSTCMFAHFHKMEFNHVRPNNFPHLNLQDLRNRFGVSHHISYSQLRIYILNHFPTAKLTQKHSRSFCQNTAVTVRERTCSTSCFSISNRLLFLLAIWTIVQ